MAKTYCLETEEELEKIMGNFKIKGIPISKKIAEKVLLHKAKRNNFELIPKGKKRIKFVSRFLFLNDSIAIIVGILFVVLMVMMGGKIMTSFNKGINDTQIFNQTIVDENFERESRYYSIFDYGIIFMFIGLISAFIISAVFIQTHPAFYFVIILGFVLMTVFGAIFANFYYGMSETESFETITERLPLTTHLMNKLPYYMVASMFIGALVLYAKFRGEGGNI